MSVRNLSSVRAAVPVGGGGRARAARCDAMGMLAAAAAAAAARGCCALRFSPGMTERSEVNIPAGTNCVPSFFDRHMSKYCFF